MTLVTVGLALGPAKKNPANNMNQTGQRCEISAALSQTSCASLSCSSTNISASLRPVWTVSSTISSCLWISLGCCQIVRRYIESSYSSSYYISLQSRLTVQPSRSLPSCKPGIRNYANNGARLNLLSFVASSICRRALIVSGTWLWHTGLSRSICLSSQPIQMALTRSSTHSLCLQIYYSESCNSFPVWGTCYF